MGPQLLRRADFRSFSDIGDLRRELESLRDENHLLRLLINAIDEPIFAKDTESRYLVLNSATARALGKPMPEILGRCDAEIVPEKNALANRDGDLAALAADGPVTTETVQPAGGKNRVYCTTKQSFRDLRGTVAGIIGIAKDMTAGRQAEEKRLRLEREHNARIEAERAVRERDEFLSIAGHELRTPITSLRAIAQLMIRQVSVRGSPELEISKRGFEIIEEQTEKLASLASQLLDVSRIGVGRLAVARERADVCSIVRSAVQATLTMSPEHPIVVDMPRRLTASVDSLRFEQVLSNLLDNAVKYGPPGGRIEVGARGLDGGGFEVTVRDHGSGIAQEARARVFERYYRAPGKPRSGGLGLGLYISRQIVELHGGTIALECPSDGGSLFRITIS